MDRPHHLLFVCTGNICRSPMAEGLARHFARERGLDVSCQSAGTLDLKGRTADPKAIKVCRELGVDLTAHTSQPLTDDLVRWADWVLCMEVHHTQHVWEHHGSLVPDDRLLLLGSFGGVHEIRDPYRGWIWTFRRSRKEIARCTEAFLDRLPHR